MSGSLTVVSAAVLSLLLGTTASANGGAIIPDVVYGHKDGMALTFDVLKPPNEANGIGILFVMSSGWVSNWVAPEVTQSWFSRLRDKGFTVFVVRHGSCPPYSLSDAKDDITRATRYIRLHASEYGVDPDRLGATSYSAGAHLALMTALTADNGNPEGKDDLEKTGDRIAAVVAFCPPVDFTVRQEGRYVFSPDGKLGKSGRAALSPIKLVSPTSPPTLLLVGDKDHLYKGTLRMHDKLVAAGVPTDLHVFPGGDHGFTNPEHKRVAEEAMVAWFEQYLVNAPKN